MGSQGEKAEDGGEDGGPLLLFDFRQTFFYQFKDVLAYRRISRKRLLSHGFIQEWRIGRQSVTNGYSGNPNNCAMARISSRRQRARPFSWSMPAGLSRSLTAAWAF